jgi:hypothetical protein
MAAPGSRVELAIGAGSGNALKPLLRLIVATLISSLATAIVVDVLRATVVAVDTNWWLRALVFIAVYLAVIGAFLLVTPKFFGEHGAALTLEPIGASRPREPVTG